MDPMYVPICVGTHRASFLRPTFSMNLSIGDRLFYSRDTQVGIGGFPVDGLHNMIGHCLVV